MDVIYTVVPAINNLVHSVDTERLLIGCGTAGAHRGDFVL